MELMVDWNSVCLVCLQEGEMKSIYEKDDKDVTLSEKIMLCSTIEIKRDNSFPEQICQSCYNDLMAAYRFRTNCESTNIILKSFLNANTADLEIPSDNGQTYKYRLPVGLNVKKIKVKPKEEPPVVIKMEKIDEEIEPANETNNFETEQFFITEVDGRFDDVNAEIDNVEDEESSAQEDKKTSYEDQEMDDFEALDDILADDGKLEAVVSLDIETRPIVRDLPSVRRKGRPRKPVRAQTQNNEDGKDLMDNPTTITYVRKVARDDGKPMKICEVCGNTYKYQHALESHMRRHRNERPFACEFCERAFVANVELRRHMRVHTGQKPYPCRYCSRRFSDFGSRIKHERTHTGERPYECATCGKAFAYAHVLSVHILTHTGEKKFRCQECGKGFTKKVYLIGHMKRHSETIQEKKPPIRSRSKRPAKQIAPQSGPEEPIYLINPKIEDSEIEMYYES